MKQMIVRILILALLLSCCPAAPLRTNAAEEILQQEDLELPEESEKDPVEYLSYHTYLNGVWIDSCGPEVSGDLVIPETLDGYPVLAIGFSAFDGCFLLDSVTIPASVTNISTGAFMNCCLYGIYVDEKNPKYCNDAYGALYSKDMTQLLQVPEMHEGSYQVPASVTEIDSWAFINCSMVSKIVVDEANPCYSSDDRGVLFDKEKTTLITAPGGITGSYTVPEGVTSLQYNSFGSCFGLTQLVMPDSVTRIGDNAFRNCFSLTKVTLSNRVAYIGMEAFYGCGSLVRLDLPASVEETNTNAFGACSSLTGIYVHKNNTCYKNDANGVLFNSGMSILLQAPGALSGSYTVPESVAVIDSYAFEDCYELTSVDIGDNVWEIGYDAFSGCFSLSEIHIGLGLRVVGARAFFCCDSLTDVYYAGTKALWNKINIQPDNECLAAAAVHFGGQEPEKPEETPDVTQWLSYTVENNKATIVGCDEDASGEIIIPEKIDNYPVTAIEEGAFLWCENITSVTIPENVVTIGDSAFESCSALTDVYISKSVSDIGTYAFYKCTKLTGIWVDENNPTYQSDDRGVLLSKDGTVLMQAPKGISGCYIVPDGVTSIGDCAFEECGQLTEVILPEQLKTISQSAFASCRKLTGIVIPDSVTSIGNVAFGGCYAMEEAIIGAGITHLGDLAFCDCLNLSYVVLGPNVSVVDEGAFDGSGVQELYVSDKLETIGSAFTLCTSLTDVYYAGTQAQWEQIQIDPANQCFQNATIHYEAEMPYEPEIPEDPEIPDVTPYLTYTVQGGQVTITGCDKEFSGEMMIPEEIEGYPVTAIGRWAFYNCGNMGLVMIPDTVTTVGEYAFQNCASLLVAYVGEGVTEIGKYAFSNNENLMAVFLPASLETVDDNAFSDCSQLAVVYYSGTQEQWAEISIGKSNEALAEAEIIYEWYAVEEPEEYVDGYLTYILEGEEAIVYYCDMEASGIVVILDAVEGCPVTVIDEYAFYWCEGVTAVAIPDSVSAIGEGAFKDCTALSDVYYAGTQAQWAQINIAAENECLTNANIHFEAEAPDKPEGSAQIGDLDGNEVVDEDDAIYLLQYVLMPELFPVEQMVDFDESGAVNEDDAIYLLQHVLMPGLFPL